MNMRLGMISAVALAAVASLGSAHASHSARTVEGQIAVPSFSIAGVPDTPATSLNGTYTRQARCAYLLAKEATGNGHDADGLAGWVIDLEWPEGNGLHTFTLASDAGNPGVTFYEDLGTCENQPASTSTGSSYTPDGEDGKIPPSSSFAIVVVEDATDANFTFSVN